MTHGHSALLARLDALKGADVASVFAELIRAGLQKLIEAEAEAEATETLSTGRYERTENRTTHLGGHRSKMISTTSGDVEAKIPKLRSGSIFEVPARSPCAGSTRPCAGSTRPCAR